MNRLLLTATIFVSVASSIKADEPPRVEGQPLAANLLRIDQTLRFFGQPLNEEQVREAVRGAEATRIQELLHPHVLFTVAIHEDGKLSVEPGEASPELQQAGYTTHLVKILNPAGRTGTLDVTSDRSGAVYGGASDFSLKRQAQTELNDESNEKGEPGRFLDVDFLEMRPMTRLVSGLEVEYAIVVISSSKAGDCPATVEFLFDDQRASTPMKFVAAPAVRVPLSIRDEDGSPTFARLEIRGALARYYPLQVKRTAPDLFFQPQIYRADGEHVLLPPGEFGVHYSRGPEYRVLEKRLTVTSDQTEPWEFRLKRWINPQEFGFFSGDHHIHAAGCAHYTHPTLGVEPADMFRQVKGEGLNVGCVLTWGPCFTHQRQFFGSSVHPLSDARTLLKYDLEISGFGSQALGHVCLLNLEDQEYPGTNGTTDGWPTWTTPVLRWAKQQGAVVGYAHSASGLHIAPRSASDWLIKLGDRNSDGSLDAMEAEDVLLPYAFSKVDADGDGAATLAELVSANDRAADELPNDAIPEMAGVGAMELPVTVTQGLCDFISAMDTRRIQEWNTWYHVMNCGFPLKVSGETDFPCMSSRRVGQGRVYVQLGTPKRLDYTAWCEGVKAGRSYVSDGYAHALEFSVNGESPGFDDVKMSAEGTVAINARVAFAPETPSGVAYGTLTPDEGNRLVGDTVNLSAPRSLTPVPGGERLVELVVNGRVVESTTVPADGAIHDWTPTVHVTRSCWVALRSFPQLHTNPVNVIIAGRPIRASRRSARWCETVIERLWDNRERAVAPSERDEARRTFERAKEVYRRISAECEPDRP